VDDAFARIEPTDVKRFSGRPHDRRTHDRIACRPLRCGAERGQTPDPVAAPGRKPALRPARAPRRAGGGGSEPVVPAVEPGRAVRSYRGPGGELRGPWPSSPRTVKVCAPR